MDGAKNSIMNLVTMTQSLAIPITILALAIVGIMFIIGTKQMKEGAKANIYYIIAGVALVVSCVTIGNWFLSNLKF